MNKYMHVQKKKIELDKWFEGCKIENDPGQKYVLAWIASNGEWFRQLWDNSSCKSCMHCDRCGHLVLQKCEQFHKAS